MAVLTSMAKAPTILGDLCVDDEGNNDAPVALLWPSLFIDHSMWRWQIVALRGAEWRTIALDPPSHGLSKGLDRGFTMDEFIRANSKILDRSFPQAGTPQRLPGSKV